MKIHEALRTHLATDSGVTAIAGTRIYAGLSAQVPTGQAVQPTIVFLLKGRADGRGTGGIVLRTSQYAILCVSSNYDTAHNLADSVETALEGFRGTMGGVGGVDIRACQITTATDEPDAELMLHVVVLGCTITFNQ